MNFKKYKKFSNIEENCTREFSSEYIISVYTSIGDHWKKRPFNIVHEYSNKNVASVESPIKSSVRMYA